MTYRSLNFRGERLANFLTTDVCCIRVVVYRSRREPSALRRDGDTLRKQTILLRVPVSTLFFFSFWLCFITHKHSIKICSNSSLLH